MARKKKSESNSGSPAWMTTFSDLMSLLLCFFVLIVSMSKVVERDFWMAAGSLRGALGTLSAEPMTVDLKNIPLPSLKNIQRAIVDKAISNMQDFIEAKKLGDDVKVVISDKGVALTISSPLLFETGSASLDPASFPLLASVFEIAKGWPNVIRVEGHTDNVPIHSEAYGSNWDLSFSRALSVVGFATDFSKIHPSRLAPVAYGQFRPVADNETEKGREKNRRIEIFMEYKKETDNPFS